MLTTSDVRDLSGLPAATLTEWVERGLVTPADPGGKGRGHSRRFSVLQAVGLAVAAGLRRSARGCSPAYARRVVGAFNSTAEDDLLSRFAAGATHFLVVELMPSDAGRGVVVLGQSEGGEGIDVGAIYRRAKELCHRRATATRPRCEASC